MRRSNTPIRQARLLRHEKRLRKDGYALIAGVDEAGRGPLAGPVVAGAVILKEYRFSSRVDDSKMLTALSRERAYREILEKAIVGVGIIDERTIDRVNIHRATMMAMELAIRSLKTDPDYVIVDGRVKIPTKCPVRCIVRGDSESLSIAAASIIAKVTRDRLMAEYDKTYPQYGFARHKGYPTRAHKQALASHGPSPIHRLSFHPLKTF